MHELYKLKDKLCEELEEYGAKKLDAGALEIVDKLTHTIKNLNKIIDKYEEDEYSNYNGMTGAYNNSYRDGSMRGGSYRNSYARGRGTNAKRDSMGRYSRRGYSMSNDAMIAELHELMQDAPDDRTRQEFQAFISKIESM